MLINEYKKKVKVLASLGIVEKKKGLEATATK
jgi:hypothetical protein